MSSSRAGMVLPDDWARVPLLDARARATAVRDIVARQTSGTPVSSSLRRDLERTLGEVSAEAARASGQLLAFSTRVIDGRPLAISVTVFRPPTPRTMHEVVDTVDPGADVAVAQGPAGTTVRQIARRGATLADGPEIDQLVVEYWLDPRDSHGLFHAVFTTPLVHFADELCGLFDTMVATVATAEDVRESMAARDDA